MAEQVSGLGGTLLVSVWFEPHAVGEGFRARITWASDVGGTEESVVVTTPSEVLTRVESWIQECRMRAARPPEQG